MNDAALAQPLPCPFCASPAEGPYFVTGGKHHWMVSCKHCGATIQRYVSADHLYFSVKAEVLALWNSRNG